VKHPSFSLPAPNSAREVALLSRLPSGEHLWPVHFRKTRATLAAGSGDLERLEPHCPCSLVQRIALATNACVLDFLHRKPQRSRQRSDELTQPKRLRCSLAVSLILQPRLAEALSVQSYALCSLCRHHTLSIPRTVTSLVASEAFSRPEVYPHLGK